MDSIIENITNIANELDEKDSEMFADALDALAENLSNIKIAQYVGSQGYWIRNSRCWANCYREKRASNPSMPAQEVWQSCHEEYLKSIEATNSGDSTADWDKYASADMPKKTDHASAIEKEFVDQIESYVDQGMDRGHAVFAAVDDIMMKPYDELVLASEQAFGIASKMFETNPREASKLAQNGETLVKEAQWWKRRMNDMTAPARGVKNIWNPAVMNSRSQIALENSINKMTTAMETILQERARVGNLANELGLNQFAQQIEMSMPMATFQQLSQAMVQANQFAQDVINRETGGEKGNPLQRGLGWLEDQAQQGADKAQKSRDFWRNQNNPGSDLQPSPSFGGDQSENPSPPASSTPNFPESTISGPGFDASQYQTQTIGLDQPRSKSQDRSRIDGPEEFNPRLAIHPKPILQQIRRMAPDLASLNRLFEARLQRSGNVTRESNAHVNSSLNLDKTAEDLQNVGGERGLTVEEYLDSLDSATLTALYNELADEIEGKNQDFNQSFTGEVASPSYAKSSTKEQKSARKGFNLAKFRDGGAK